MITDGQRKAFEKWVVENTPFTEPRKYNSGLYEQQIHHFLLQVWLAAQQIKPLEFVECSIQYRDLPVAYLKAETPLGKYTIHKYKYFGDQFATNYFYSGPGNGGKSVAAEATAIEAANEDYRKRVLSCLVWGGV